MGVYLHMQKSTAGDAVLVTDYATDYVYRGGAFSLVDVVQVAGASTASFLFDTTASGYVSVHPPMFTTTTGPVLVKIYAGTDYTATTEMNVQNRNVHSEQEPLCMLYSGATGTDEGAEMIEYVIPGGHKSAGSASDALPYVLDGVKYLITIENTDSASAYVGINFTWFED